MTSAPTPGDKLRAYAHARGWPQGDLDYLLGVLGEAVLVERERCARLAEGVPDCNCMKNVGFCECYGSTSFTELAAAIRARKES